MRLQSQLVKIVAAVPGVIFSFRSSPDGSGFTFVSAAIEAMCGLSPAELEHDAQAFFERIHAEDVEGFRAALAGTLAWHHEMRLAHPARGAIWVEGRAVPESEAGGSTLWHGYLVDISERKALERSLIDKQNRLEEKAARLAAADRRKDELLAVLGHELRNPLAPIRSAAQALANRKQPTRGQVREAIDLIARQSEQLKRLIDDLLDLARINDGLLPLHHRPVDLRGVVGAALESVAPMIASRHHHLETRVPEQPVMVMADPVRMTQACSNLLVNAAKFTPDGGRIGLVLVSEGEVVRLSVADNGIGMDADQLAEPFGPLPWWNGGSARWAPQQGLGLGLALTQEIMRAHGGELQVSSAGPGQGSKFVLKLAALATQLTAPPALPKARRLPSRRQRVMVVDDSEAIGRAFAMLLDSLGQDARYIVTAPDALPMIEAWMPEIIILDVFMPVMDGYQLATAIRSSDLSPQPFIVAVSGYSEDRVRADPRAGGFDEIALKPLDGDRLIEILNRAGAAGAGKGDD